MAPCQSMPVCQTSTLASTSLAPKLFVVHLCCVNFQSRIDSKFQSRISCMMAETRPGTRCCHKNTTTLKSSHTHQVLVLGIDRRGHYTFTVSTRRCTRLMPLGTRGFQRSRHAHGNAQQLFKSQAAARPPPPQSLAHLPATHVGIYPDC